MCKVVDIDVVFRRTVELIEYCEQVRRENGITREIAYEVGTEETIGGLTSLDTYEGFIKRIKAYTTEHELPMPIFIVGQTGTLTRLTKNVGHFNYENSKKLSDIAAKYGVGLKEHNGDYLSEDKLLAHLPLGITAMNVAPAFGTIETRALLEFLKVEEKFAELGVIKEPSRLYEVMTHASVYSMKRKKWCRIQDGLACCSLSLDQINDELALKRLTQIEKLPKGMLRVPDDLDLNLILEDSEFVFSPRERAAIIRLYALFCTHKLKNFNFNNS